MVLFDEIVPKTTNNFKGIIPDAVADLPRLKKIDLSYNDFSRDQLSPDVKGACVHNLLCYGMFPSKQFAPLQHRETCTAFGSSSVRSRSSTTSGWRKRALASKLTFASKAKTSPKYTLFELFKYEPHSSIPEGFGEGKNKDLDFYLYNIFFGTFWTLFLLLTKSE